jgi:hypothetical protein
MLRHAQPEDDLARAAIAATIAALHVHQRETPLRVQVAVEALLAIVRRDQPGEVVVTIKGERVRK